jgi:hypothetical protein
MKYFQHILQEFMKYRNNGKFIKKLYIHFNHLLLLNRSVSPIAIIMHIWIISSNYSSKIATTNTI